jgi:hypothetical protein
MLFAIIQVMDNENKYDPSDRLNQQPRPTPEQATALIALRELLAQREEGGQVSRSDLNELRAIVWTIPPAAEMN